MDLIISSESGLTSKVIGPFSSHCSEKDNQDTFFSGFEFMRRLASDVCTSDNCHGSYLVSFYIFCISWNRSYPSKRLVAQLIWHANPGIRELIFYWIRSCFLFSMITDQFKSLFSLQFEKRLRFPDRKLSNIFYHISKKIVRSSPAG